MVVKTFTKGLFYTILGVAALGFLAGLAMAGSDIVNPWTSQAAAAQTQAIVEYETEKNSIDLHYYAQERSLEAIANETRINRNLAYQQRMNEIKLKLMDIGGKVAIFLVAYLVVLSTFLYFWYRFHQLPTMQELPVTQEQNPKRIPAYLRPLPTSSRNSNGRVHKSIQNGTAPGRSRIDA